MRCLPRCSIRVVLALMTATPCACAWAVDWRLGRGQWSGDVGLAANYSHHANESSASSSSSSTSRLRESLRLQGNGLYVLDPRLIDANLGFSTGSEQNQVSGESASSRSNQKVTDYNFDANILKFKPYPIQVYANRNLIDTNLDYGGHSAGTSENRGFSVSLQDDSPLKQWVGPWFTANVSASEQHLEQTSSYFDRVIQVEQTRREVRAGAQKGFTTADLRLRYLAVDQSNAAQAQVGNQYQLAFANYNVDFGPGLNRNFDSTLSYSSRNTLLPSNTLTATETLSVVHSNSLSSDYGYSISRDEADGAVTRSQSGTVGVSHSLYQNLSTRVQLQGERFDVATGKRSGYRGSFSQSYRHSLPGKGNLGLSWGANYARNSSALSSGIVKDSEQFNAPAAADPAYPLDKRFVVVDSIRVYNLRNFPVVQELVRDTDFTVEVNGNLTSIRLLYPVPTNPADPVLPGDQLKVTYDVQVDAKLESESRGTGFGAAVGYGWIGVSYNHQQSTSQVLSGEALFLFDRTQVDSMNVTMNGSWRGFATSALASHTRSSSSRFDLEETDNTSRLSLQGSGRLYGMDARATANVERYRGTSTGFDMRMINASLFWRPYGNWQASFNATASNSQYLNPVRQTTFLSAQASLYWNPDSGWRHQAFAQIEREDSGSSAVSTLMKLGAQTQRQLGKLTFNANASLGYIQSSGSSGLSESIGFNIRRAL